MSERTIISFDYAIKTILRDKANFDILEGFLSELLKRKVTVLDILESESNRQLKGGKTNRVDLKAKIDNGELAIFEIQFADQVDFFGKILYSSSKAIVEQIGKGKKFNIKKVYSINIAYFDLGAKREYLFHADMLSFKGMHYNEQIPFAQNDELAPPTLSKKHIHPEYYLILPNMFSEHIKTRFDEWMHILKNSTVKKGFKAKGTKQAGIKLDVLKMTAVEQKVYEKFLMDRQSIDSAMWTAEAKGRAEGRVEGKAEGRAEGKAEGRAEGKAEGRAEGKAEGRAEGEAIGVKKGEAIGIKKGEKKGSDKEKIKIARNLKKAGMDARTVAKMTGLTVEEMKKLK